MNEREFPPITDTMREPFVERITNRLYERGLLEQADEKWVRWTLDDLANLGARVTIDAPEFRVHTDDCCGGDPMSTEDYHNGDVPCPGVPGYWPRSAP